MGLLSPIASSQWSTIGWFTGCATDPRLAAARGLDLSAASWMSSTVTHLGTLGTFRPDAAIISRITSFTPPPNVITRLRLVWRVEPVQQFGGVRLGRVAVLADDLLGESPDILNALGAKHFRRRRIGDVDRLARPPRPAS